MLVTVYRATETLALLVVLAATMSAQPTQPDLALKHLVALEYPWFARMGEIQGDVPVVLTLTPQGKVTKVRILSGPKPLADAVRSALEKWQFAAMSCAGETCEAEIVFSFVLAGSCNAGSHCPSQFELDLPRAVRISAKAFMAIAH